MFRQAIQTKYLGAANSRGTRIKATAPGGSITVPYNAALNEDQNHQYAADMLARKFGWTGPYIGGCFGGDHYFVSLNTLPEDWATRLQQVKEL
jgi:hypothetical protein